MVLTIMAALASASFRDRYGPWALVTGASSGIGEAFARELAARGFQLVITARRAALLESLAASLRSQHGVDVQVAGLDLGQTDFLPELVSVCAGKDIGLVVSNAGFGLKGEHHTLDAARLASMVNVNAFAPMQLAHAFAPRLIARGRGGMLFTGSLESYLGFPWSSAYAASKAFVTVLGEGLWGELAPRGVDVLVISPGATDTDALDLQGIDKRKIPGRMMAPGEVARQALGQLGKKPVFIPGFSNRWLIRLLAALPRRTGLRLAGKGIRDTMA
jgi:short-subunit dehydrogenase